MHNPLYHATIPINFFQILESNTLKASEGYLHCGKDKGISFSRNKDIVIKDIGSCCFEIDTQRLINDIGIQYNPQPFDYDYIICDMKNQLVFYYAVKNIEYENIPINDRNRIECNKQHYDKFLKYIEHNRDKFFREDLMEEIIYKDEIVNFNNYVNKIEIKLEKFVDQLDYIIVKSYNTIYEDYHKEPKTDLFNNSKYYHYLSKKYQCENLLFFNIINKNIEFCIETQSNRLTSIMVESMIKYHKENIIDWIKFIVEKLGWNPSIIKFT